MRLRGDATVDESQLLQTDPRDVLHRARRALHKETFAAESVSKTFINRSIFGIVTSKVGGVAQ